MFCGIRPGSTGAILIGIMCLYSYDANIYLEIEFGNNKANSKELTNMH